MEHKSCHRPPLRPEQIGPRVMELSKYLRKNFNAAVAEQGLFFGQQDILLLLIHQPGMTLGQLSRALGVASATASVSVKRMEKAGFIEKRADRADARVIRLYPTPLAENAPKKIYQKMDALEGVLTAGMSESQVLTLAQLLEQALNNVGQEGRPEESGADERNAKQKGESDV